jgi:hypothetical protein
MGYVYSGIGTSLAKSHDMNALTQPITKEGKMNKLMMITILMMAPIFTACSLPVVVHMDHSHRDLIGGEPMLHNVIDIVAKGDVTRPYRVLGEVSVRMTESGSPDAVLDQLRLEANKLGGDALMDVGVEVPSNPGGQPAEWVNYKADVISFDQTDLRTASR